MSQYILILFNHNDTAWKVSKYEVFSGPYFPVFGPEKSPYLDAFHAVWVSMHEYYSVNVKIINHIKTSRDLSLMSSTLISKNKNWKWYILLKVIDDIIIDCSNTNDFIQQKLNEKCDRKGLSIYKVTCFFSSLEANQAFYISYKTCILYAIGRFKSAICLIKILEGA